MTPDMVEPLAGIGMSVTDHALYLTITSRGAVDRSGAAGQQRRRAE